MDFLKNDGPSALEKLIHDCEFENQQYVKLIEHEDTLLSNTEKETEWKQSEIQRLEEANSQLDGEVKQLHRQFVQNKDNLESQKKTGHILSDQITAVSKNLDILLKKREDERADHDRVLQHYRDICDRYKEKYESFPLAKELKKAQAEEEEVRKLVEEKKNKITSLKQNLQFLISKKEGNTMTKDDQDFILQLAKVKLTTLQLSCEIQVKAQEVQTLKQTTRQTQQQQQTYMAHTLQHSPVRQQKQRNTTKAEVIESPMISVFSGRDEDGDETRSPVMPPTTETETTEQQEPPQSWLANFQKLQVQPSEPVCSSVAPTCSLVASSSVTYSGPVRAEMPQHPYVAYKKTVAANNQAEETIKVHLRNSVPAAVSTQQMPVNTFTPMSVQPRPECAPETIKRTFQPENNPLKSISPRGQNSDTAIPEMYIQRPKIPKLELRSPHFIEKPSITSQAASPRLQAPTQDRYRSHIPQVQIPRYPAASQTPPQSSGPAPVVVSRMVQMPRQARSVLVSSVPSQPRPALLQNSVPHPLPAGQRQQYPQSQVPQIARQVFVPRQQATVPRQQAIAPRQQEMYTRQQEVKARQQDVASEQTFSPERQTEEINQQLRTTYIEDQRNTEIQAKASPRISPASHVVSQNQQHQIGYSGQNPHLSLPQTTQNRNDSPATISVVQSPPTYPGQVQPSSVPNSRPALVPQPSPLPDMSSRNLPDTSSWNFPDTSSRNALDTSSRNLPDMSSRNLPDLSSRNLPDLSSRNLPNMSSRNLPDLSSRNLPDMSSRNLPDMSSRNLPDLSSRNDKTTTPEQSADQSRSPDQEQAEKQIKLNMLGPSKPYFVKLKGDSEDEQLANKENTASPGQLPSYSAAGLDSTCLLSASRSPNTTQQSDSYSPFNMKKHQQRLAELKALSPGIPTFKADHRMFGMEEQEDKNKGLAVNSSPGNEDSPGPMSSQEKRDVEGAFNFFSSFGSPDPPCTSTSKMFAFGGGDASENMATSFSLFGNSSEDKNSTSFGMFGKEQDSQQSGGFDFGFGGGQKSPASSNALSLFGSGGDDDKGGNEASGFSFSFGSGVDSPQQQFSLF